MINTAIRSAWGMAWRSFVKAVKVTLQTTAAVLRAHKYSLGISDKLNAQRREYDKLEQEKLNNYWEKMR